MNHGSGHESILCMEAFMELKPLNDQKISELIRKGVDIPNPLTVDIGEEVLLRTFPAAG